MMNCNLLKIKRIIPFLLLVFLTACGELSNGELPNKESDSTIEKEDTNVTETPHTVNECKQSSYNAAIVKGRFFQKAKGDGQTEQNFGVADPEDNALKGVADKKVGLILEGHSTEKEVTTCPDGRFYFENVNNETPRVGLFHFHDNTCTTANCPTNFAKLAAEGKTIKIVTFGDSIGDTPSKPEAFPQRLKELAAPVAQIDNVNEAKGGTRTYEWVPGSKLFEERIAKNNKDADVYIFSLGGNNVLVDMLKTLVLVTPAKIERTLQEKKKDIDKAFEEGRQIIDKLREFSPNADIVWISYMNYASSLFLLNLFANPKKQQAIRNFVHQLLVEQRDFLAGYKNVMVVDMFGLSMKPNADGTPFDINAHLRFDNIHYSHKGHYFLASQLFKVLGGMFIGDYHVGPEPTNPKKSYDVSNFGVVKYIGYP